MEEKKQLIVDLEREILNIQSTLDDFSSHVIKYISNCDTIEQFIHGIKMSKYGIQILLDDYIVEDALKFIYEDDEKRSLRESELYGIIASSPIMELLDKKRDNYIRNFFTSLLNDARKKANEYTSIMTDEKKKVLNRKKDYLTMIEILKHIDNKYTYDKDLSKIKATDEYTYRFLKIILKNNNRLYNELLSSNKLLSNITIDELDKLLLDNNYTLSKDDKDKLYLYGEIDNIRGIIEESKMNNLMFFNPSFPHFINILLYSSKDIFKTIGIALRDTQMDINFFYNNPGILISNEYKIDGIESKYEIFINNVNLLKRKGINIGDISKYDSNLLLSDSDCLLRHITLLSSYRR
jgi:hypothetical protein